MIELRTKDEILQLLSDNWNDDDNTKLPPMFHGTDVSLVGMPKTERDRLNSACETIIEAVYDLFVSNNIDMYDERLIESQDSYGRSSSAYSMAQSRLKKSPYYSYGDFYVTNNPERAISYSKEAWIFGETGWAANRLVEGAYALGLDLPDDDGFIDPFEIFSARKSRSKAPVVLVITNGDPSDLSFETGKNCKEFFQEDYPEELQFLKDSMSSSISYRLKIDRNMDGIYVVNEAGYSELMDAWNTLARIREQAAVNRA